MLRACVEPGCGLPSEQARCPEHRRAPWETSERRSARTVSGWEEQRRAKRVLERLLGCCHVCGGLEAGEVDHVVPLGEGGADEAWNLAPIHSACHRLKTARESARARRGGPAHRSKPTGGGPRTASAPGAVVVAARAPADSPQGDE